MPAKPSRTQYRWALAAALVVVMALALLPPEIPTPTTGWDKLNHALAFSVLALLGFASYPGRTVLLLSALLAYGGMIELLQGLTDYRSAEWLDWGGDCVGLAAGSLLTRLSPHFRVQD